jgi:selenocysteine lyase/cysteine desulfurase
VARRAGVPYLLDGAQSAGQIDLDVEALGCDFLVGTGRKFVRGPRGTGFLYVSPRMLERTEPPVVDHTRARWVAADRYEMGPDARRYENWEFNYAAVLGLGAAVDEALAWGVPVVENVVASLAEALRERLVAAGFDTYDLGEQRCAIVTTVVPGVESTEVQRRLAEQGINVSVTTPGSTLLDFERRNLPDLLRLSVHYFNLPGELDAAVEALAGM